jgi:phage shock protein E
LSTLRCWTEHGQRSFSHVLNRMKAVKILSLLFCLLVQTSNSQTEIPNRLIDYSAFLNDATKVQSVRASRRLTEAEFLNAMSEPGVVLLDARSAAKFKLRHLEGAVHLTLPDFTAAELAKIIPRKDTTVLIYCNNNFQGSPAAFPSKAIGASLNLSTFVNLTTYGYTNVYELGPLLDVKNSKLPFAGDEVK